MNRFEFKPSGQFENPYFKPSKENPSVQSAIEMGRKNGLKEVDMQFNLLRREGKSPSGFDAIDPQTRARLMWVPKSSSEAESKIRNRLGSHAVFAILQEPRLPEGHTYKVPQGTRRLDRTMRAAPYEEPYMNRLKAKAQGFLKTLQAMDPDAFGVRLESLAISHNGEDSDGDDAFICAIPPINPPLVDQNLKVEEL